MRVLQSRGRSPMNCASIRSSAVKATLKQKLFNCNQCQEHCESQSAHVIYFQKLNFDIDYKCTKFPYLLMLYLTDHSASCSRMPERDRDIRYLELRKGVPPHPQAPPNLQPCILFLTAINIRVVLKKKLFICKLRYKEGLKISFPVPKYS